MMLFFSPNEEIKPGTATRRLRTFALTSAELKTFRRLACVVRSSTEIVAFSPRSAIARNFRFGLNASAVIPSASGAPGTKRCVLDSTWCSTIWLPAAYSTVVSSR